MASSMGWNRILAVMAAACVAAAAAFPRTAAASGPEAWGAFGGLAGACWADASELTCFGWDMRGETLRQSTYGATGEQVVMYRLDLSGTSVQGDDGSRLHAPRANVTVRELASTGGPMRVVYRLQGDQLEISIQQQNGAQWVQVRTQRRVRADDAQVAQARASAEAFRQQQRKVWGVLADLAGHRYVLPGTAGYLFSWEDAGRTLRFAALHDDGTGDKVREITYDAGRNAFVVTMKYRYVGNGRWFSRGEPGDGFLLADGGFFLTSPGVRIGQDESGNLTIQSGEASRSGQFQPEGAITHVSPASREAYASVEHNSRLAGEQQYQRAVEADRARAAAEASESSDSGLFGALVGAAVGAYAGSAAGLDASQTLDLMVQGAAATGSGPVADGFARGWQEETAKQEAMQRSLEQARYRGLAQGTAEYSRRQGDSYATASNTSTAVPTSLASPADATDPAEADGGAQEEDAPGKPLRFVLRISMRNLPGDKHNASCYSSIITRPGPPGWGATWTSHEAAEQAIAEAEALKSSFIEACRRASGREITNEGNFVYYLNRHEADEQQVEQRGPEVEEDVLVMLQ